MKLAMGIMDGTYIPFVWGAFMNKEITVSNEEYTISTLDIADMMGMQHKSILRKLEGRTEKRETH